MFFRWPELLGDLVELEGLGLVRTVRVLRAGVDLELGQLLSRQLVLGEHALDGLLDRTLGALGEQLGVGGRGEAAGVVRVAVRDLLLQLVAGEGDLVRIDDDHEIAGVHVGSEGRLVLPAQQCCGLAGKTTQDDVGGVDDVPLTLDVTGLRSVRTHVDLPSFVW